MNLSELDRQRTERAYLSIDNEHLIGLTVGKPLKSSIETRNIGHTPALRVSFTYRWKIRPNNKISAPIDNYINALKDSTGNPSINQTLSKTIFTTKPLTQQQVILLNSGNYKIELQVAARYYDVFDKVHTARLCTVYGKYPNGEWGDGRCRSGNNSD